MAWDAVCAGARGLVFFGGHLTRAGDRPLTKQRDIAHGWNWTFWEDVLRRLVRELSAGGLAHPLLVAPASRLAAQVHLADGLGHVTGTVPKDVRVLVRETPTAVFLVLLKRGGSATVRVQVALPGQRLRARGYVLGEEPRMVDTVALPGGGSAFLDWLAPWDVHVYKIGKA